jgi:hypothetical protein
VILFGGLTLRGLLPAFHPTLVGVEPLAVR